MVRPPVDAIVFAVALVALAGSGLFAASSLRLRSAAESVLAAYVIAYGALVALSLFLSVFDALGQAALVTGALALLAATAGIWLLLGAPAPPSPRASATGVLRAPQVAALTVAAAGTLAYVVALILGTAPNGWDQLNYHLARAALWVEQQGVGYVAHAYDQRISSYPPNAEVALAFVLAVGRYEALAATVQLTAALACSVGVWALSRRLGLRATEAAFGALLFFLTPIVILQSSTPKNDLVVASFLVVAAVFLLGESRRELALAGLAVALAVGTKFTAAYGVVVLVMLAVLITPRSNRLVRIFAVVLGALAGSYWYVLNLVETRMILGDTSGIPGLTAPLRPRENLVEAVGLAIDMIDLSGAKGADLLLYAILASGIVAAVVLARGDRSSKSALLAGLIVVSPLALWVVTTQVGRPLFTTLHSALGEPQAYIPPDDDPSSSPTFASDTGSWYGPAGFLLVVGVAIAALPLVRRGQLPRVALVVGGAPLLYYALVSLSLTYHPWQGRFFLFPVALSATLWGLTLRRPPVAWGLVALTMTTAALSLVHYAEKPSGLRLLEREPSPSVWKMKRWEVQSLHDPAQAPLLRFLDESVPRDAPVALALGVNDFGYPAFGPRMERRIVLVPFGSSANEIDADWLFATGGRATEIDQGCWSPELVTDEGSVFRQRSACGG
jgi:hypothetical protein